MKKKLKLVIVSIIFLGLLVPSIGTADIDDDVLTEGDTFLYDIRNCDVPWEMVFKDILPFSMEDFILDLSSSTLGVKVTGIDERDGFYALNTYIILGKNMQIPIPEDYLTPQLEDTVYDIFGDTIVIPEGAGISLGSSILGSDFLEFIDSDYEELPGIPFYFDVDEWNQYEDMFEDLAEILDDANIDITTEEKNGEFIVIIEGSVGEGAQAQYSWTTTTEPWWWTTEYTTTAPPMGSPEIDGDLMFEVAWFADGDHAGVFKRVKGSFTGDIGDVNNLDVNVEVTFDEKRHNPLPDEILDEETITLEMEFVSFTYDTTGFFEDNEDIQDQLDDMDDSLQDAEGEDMFIFDIKSVEGCYYETDIEVYEGEDSEGVWWNGFIGASGWKDDWVEDPWEDWRIHTWPVSYFHPLGYISFGIFPLAAPGITPDWDMWQGSILAISSIFEAVRKAVTSSDAEDALSDIGVTLNTFDIRYEMRGNNDYKFFYFTGEVDLEYDVNDIVGWVSEDPEESKADVKVNIEAWIGYTADGLIVSIGVNLKVVAIFEEYPLYSEYNYETYEYETCYDDGSIKLELNAEMKNKDIRDIPDPATLQEGIQKTTSEGSIPESTRKEGSSSDESSESPVISPSFSLIPVLIILAAFSMLLKRKQY